MKALGFLLLFPLVLGDSYRSAITKTMIKYEVIPDVVSEGAPYEMQVSYEDADVVAPQTLTPTQTKDKPEDMNWLGQDNSYYTLIFTAPDGPRRTNPVYREVIKWLVVNIPGNHFEKGEEIVEYVGAAPEKQADLSRYVYLAYKQQGKHEFDEQKIDKYTFDARKNFSTRKFLNKYKMGPEAVAATFFQARYDDYVPVIYKQINYTASDGGS